MIAVRESVVQWQMINAGWLYGACLVSRGKESSAQQITCSLSYDHRRQDNKEQREAAIDVLPFAPHILRLATLDYLAMVRVLKTCFV